MLFSETPLVRGEWTMGVQMVRQKVVDMSFQEFKSLLKTISLPDHVM